MSKFVNKGRVIDLDYRPRLEQIRKNFDLTRKEFAEMININYQHYTRVERGTMNLSQDALVKIATIFEVDFIWLITGHDDLVKKSVKK